MRMFSILQSAVALSYPMDGKLSHQLVQFSEDPDDSSIVRMRITPPTLEGSPMPNDAHAVEITFDRNGRERSRRLWPMKYPVWDSREPAEIDKEIEERRKVEDEKLPPVDAEEPPQSAAVKAKGRAK